MMQVPPELQQQRWQDIEQLERNHTMPYITSVERIGIEKGMQQDESAVLARRFGPLSAETQAQVNSASLEQLDHWVDNILDAATLEQVFSGDH